MKTCILFVCVVAILWVEANADCPPLDNPKGKHTVKEGTVFYKDCTKFTCQNGGYNALGCATSRCKDQTGETPYDYSKPYPECCPKPICPKKN